MIVFEINQNYYMS